VYPPNRSRASHLGFYLRDSITLLSSGFSCLLLISPIPGTRPILLQLDSGSDGPILYAGNKETELPLLKRAKLRERTPHKPRGGAR
jgi:hypothetical protein